MKRSLKVLLWKHLLADIRNGRALHHLQALLAPDRYLPWTSAVVNPAALVPLLNDIQVNRRSVIVECGGGVSTILIGRLLEQLGRSDAHLYSIEHDAEWVRELNGLVRTFEIDDWVTIVEAPLVRTSHSHSVDALWYSTETLNAVEGFSDVDLLFVDGPPAHAPSQQHARYPALPYFIDRLGTRFCVILDDISRRGEHEIVQAWADQYDMAFEERILHGDYAICTRGDAFTIS